MNSESHAGKGAGSLASAVRSPKMPAGLVAVPVVVVAALLARF